MKSILQQQRHSSMISAIVTIALGCVMLMWPTSSVNIICSLLGGALTITGILYGMGWLTRRKAGSRSTITLLPCVILIGLGVWMMVRPGSVVAVIQYVFSALIIFHGILDLQSGFALMRQKSSRWWIELSLAAVTIGLGVLVLLNPFGTFSTLVMLIGGVLIFDGVSDLWIIHRLSRALRDFGSVVDSDIIESEARDLDE